MHGHSDISNNYERLFCVQDQWLKPVFALTGRWRSTCMVFLYSGLMAESGLCTHRLVKVYLHENTLILPILRKNILCSGSMAKSGLCSHRLEEVYLHENILILPNIMKDYSVFMTHGREARLLPQARVGLIALVDSDISNNSKRLLCVQDQWRRAASAPVGWWGSDCMSTL